MEASRGEVIIAEVTANQLRSLVERARRRTDGGRPVLVSGRMDGDTTSLSEVGEVFSSGSPLEVRSLLSSVDGDRLVVVTTCDHHELGADAMARVAGERVWVPNRWDTVKEMFSARAVSRDLSRKNYLADALIEARPLNGYSPVRTGTLDTDTALAALLRAYLKMPTDLEGLDSFLRWTMAAESMSLLGGIRADVTSDVRGALSDRFGPGTTAVLAILDGGERDQLIPMCLVAGIVHHPSAGDNLEPRLRLSMRLGEPSVTSDEWMAASDVAMRYVRNHEDRNDAIDLTRHADRLLAELQGDHLAILSDVLPSGFGLRVRSAAEALAAWDGQRVDAQLENEAHTAIVSAASHDSADLQRVERMRMAARLIRRGDESLEWGSGLSDAALRYRSEGAWTDLARTDVSRGESNPVLAALYTKLTDRLNSSRERDNERFSRFNIAALDENASVIGLERVMEEVVAPVAAKNRVMVVVLDGMGWPSFLEVYRSIAPTGWVWMRDAEGRFDRCGVAVLPTITEVSRTSLFAGTIRKGTGESEERAFMDLDALKSVSKPGYPPSLHHKAELRDGGLDTVPTPLLADIANANQQVVAVVLNNIDERLKDAVMPPEGWDLPNLDPMRWLLDAARDAGRVVILTADHGHILDRDAQQVSAPGGGERWKSLDQGVVDGEVQVAGPRVVGPTGMAGDAVVLPYVEQRFYGVRRNGYHGGITPQEVLVPVAVLSSSELLDTWEPVSFSPPSWWHHRAAETPAAVFKSPVSGDAAPTTATLFEGFDGQADEPWVDSIVDALRPLWNPRIRLAESEVAALLSALVGSGGMAMSQTQLAELSGLPLARIGRYVSQLQQLVNVDGYGVVTVVNGEVRLYRDLLETQLGLS